MDKKAVKWKLIGPLEGQRDTSLDNAQDIGQIPYELWNRPSTSKGPIVMQHNAKNDAQVSYEDGTVSDGKVSEESQIPEGSESQVPDDDDYDVFNDAETSNVADKFNFFWENINFN